MQREMYEQGGFMRVEKYFSSSTPSSTDEREKIAFLSMFGEIFYFFSFRILFLLSYAQTFTPSHAISKNFSPPFSFSSCH
jgi:hypothetical protein